MSTEQTGPLSGPATFGSALACAGADPLGLAALCAVLLVVLAGVVVDKGELEGGELDAGELTGSELTGGGADEGTETTTSFELGVLGAAVTGVLAARTEFTVTVTTPADPAVLDAVHPAEATRIALATNGIRLVRNLNA